MTRDKLKALRGERSQAEVASLLGVTRQMLSALETGNRTPSLELAKRIAELYGVSIEEVFFDDSGNGVRPTGADL